MGYLDDPIWQALAAMRIEPDGAALTFTRRLARDNGWSARYASDVMAEYRRFLYLAATGCAPVTPSEQIDQAWHLHLAYSRHYWGELCGRIIGRPLHHGPTAGGRAEAARYRNLYADTLTRYRETFGHAPPAAIWPPGDVRFAGTFQWVDTKRHVIVPRRTVTLGGAAAAAVSLAACTAIAADASAPERGSALDRFFGLILESDLAFFGFVTALFIVMVVIVQLMQRMRQRKQRQSTQARRRRIGGDGSSVSVDSSDTDWTLAGSGTAAASSAAFAAGGGDFGGAGADGSWDSSDSGSDGGGGDSGCGGGCGGGD